MMIFRKVRDFAVTALVFCFLTALAQGFDARAVQPLTIPPIAPGNLRLMSWNIEFLGARTPPRTEAQLALLSDRISSFNAAAMTLQEITSVDTFTSVVAAVGGNWVGLRPGVENAIIYDSSKLEKLSSGVMSALANEPYTAYPGAVHRKPVTAVFRPVGGNPDEKFRLIGIHCHWSDASVREAEGTWLKNRVAELLADPAEPKAIFVMGDTNSWPGSDLQNKIIEGGYLERLLKANGENTAVLTYGPIDHCFTTALGKAKLASTTAFVIRADEYGETATEFEATYSDHYPILVDYVPQPASANAWEIYD